VGSNEIHNKFLLKGSSPSFRLALAWQEQKLITT
jgi:hypothetical protein